MKKLYTFLIFFCAVGSFFSQSKKSIERLAEKAESYFEDKLYAKAYDSYSQLEKLDPGNKFNYLLKKGKAAAFIPSKKEEAIQILEDLYRRDSSDISLLLYLGEAYHHNYQFEKAIQFISRFIVLNEDLKEEELANLFLMHSRNGSALTQSSIRASIRNIGSPINTSDAEYVPVVSSDNSMLLFTYRGRNSTGGLMDSKFNPDPEGDYYEDIFYSVREGDGWTSPKSIGDNINTKHNDAAIALSPDKNQLYTFYSSEEDGGDIYVCNRIATGWEKPVALGPNINTSYWEGSCSVSGDGKSLYFASERPGGYGGKDIYVSTLQDDGTWGPAVNLGASINTKYDDDSPYIISNDLTLFFSSKGHQSIGGFDIHFTMRKDNSWTSPQNLGFPVNTTDDDIYYVITADGKLGYYSSTRDDAGGAGSHDIYVVSPGIISEPPVVAVLNGLVFGNKTPVQAELSFSKKSNGELVGPIKTNSVTNEYIVSLSPGETYSIKVAAPGFPDYQEEFAIPASDTFLFIKKDFYFKMDSLPQVFNDTTKLMVKNPCDDAPIPDFTPFKGKDLNDAKVYDKVLDLISSFCESKIIYRVQIAAYRHPENYSWKHLMEFGQPEIEKMEDGITRFTQGRYTSIREAEAQRQKSISRGQKDAWLTALVNGKRFTLQELIQNDFFLEKKAPLK
jgi:hypothetical protein